MDHAEVRKRLAEAFATGSGISTIEADASSEGQGLRDHISSCCREEYEAFRATALALAAIAPDDELRAPRRARERIMASVGAQQLAAAGPAFTATPAVTPVAPPSASERSARPSVPQPRYLAIAAAVAAAIFLAGAFLGGALGLAPASPDDEAAAHIVAAVDRIVAQPDSVQLAVSQASSGAHAGTLLFDPANNELVILSRSLTAPPSGEEYGCYLERQGARTRVGRMRVEYGTAWWVGKMEDPADAGAPGDRFVVLLGGPDGAPVLVSAF